MAVPVTMVRESSPVIAMAAGVELHARYCRTTVTLRHVTIQLSAITSSPTTFASEFARRYALDFVSWLNRIDYGFYRDIVSFPSSRCDGRNYGKDCELSASTCREANPCVEADSSCDEDETGNATCTCTASMLINYIVVPGIHLSSCTVCWPCFAVNHGWRCQ